MKKNKIEFIKTKHSVSDLYNPVPASKNIPDWYKNISSYIGEEKRIIGEGQTLATIKKCMPVFDSISSGYLLKTYCDIEVIWNENCYEFKTPAHLGEVIVSHSLEQLTGYPKLTERYTFAPKFLNAWSIKTSKGYSSLIIPPMHRENKIVVFPGIIDSDTFHDVTNLPFLLDIDEDITLIPAGTPIAQIIPIKRDSWEMSIETNSESYKKTSNAIRSVFFEAYKSMFWVKKSYK